ncbi:hypothetical protein tpqmel_1062, partial [Candidatus Gastranaerophilus sp. (ex Termes propinquus)]
DTIVKVEAKMREEGKNPRQLRASGSLPATLYGKNIESVSFAVDAHSFGLIYRANKEATFELKLDSKTYNAQVQDVQMNYATNQMLNVEFKAV